MDDKDAFQPQWALLELMGHRRLVGIVSERQIAGKGFLQIDLPDKEEADLFTTQIYNPDSVYGLTPIDEEIGRKMAQEIQSHPVYALHHSQLGGRGEDDW